MLAGDSIFFHRAILSTLHPLGAYSNQGTIYGKFGIHGPDDDETGTGNDAA
jgi:hypothetical protein